MKTYKKYTIRIIILLVLFLLAILLNSCNKYYSPEKYANPRHRYIIRTNKGEREMTRILRQSTFRRKTEGCGYQK
jgi:cell division protein YceG involved in septum cleavage